MGSQLLVCALSGQYERVCQEPRLEWGSVHFVHEKSQELVVSAPCKIETKDEKWCCDSACGSYLDEYMRWGRES